MGARRLVALLSRVSALSRPIDWRQGWWRSKHHTESETQEWGLESKFGWGPRHPGQEGDGLVLLVPGYKRGVCFQGTQLGTLVRKLPPSRYDLSYL